MKEVKITDTLLKEYKDSELVHYLAAQLRHIAVTAGTENPEWIQVNYGGITVDIEHLAEIASAVDKRMNKTADDPKFAM